MYDKYVTWLTGDDSVLLEWVQHGSCGSIVLIRCFKIVTYIRRTQLAVHGRSTAFIGVGVRKVSSFRRVGS